MDVYSPSPDDSKDLLKLSIKEAEKDGSISKIATTYDLHNNILRDGYNYDGKKLITFSNILKHKTLPIADIIQKVLQLGEQEMGKPVEIEFVVDLTPNANEKVIFDLLQIRPIASIADSVNIDKKKIKKKESLIISDSALGNGIVNNIHDIVYVRPQNFNAANNKETVNMVGAINEQFSKSGKNFILIGPGRWGSSDPWLGIPVKWPQISNARLIIESGIDKYRIDPSQGTHFFQNLTSFRVGYFTINPFINDGYYDIKFLDSQKAVFENETVRHIRFKKPIQIVIDGRKNTGVVLKPGYKYKK